MRSKHHNINPAGANLSHTVNHLSFGNVLSKHAVKRLNEIPDDYFSMESTYPMNGNFYVNDRLHQAYHHYIKVVSTYVEMSKISQRESNTEKTKRNKPSILAYQMVESSQVMMYEEDGVPEARFSYDLSPMAVVITRRGKRWYEFVTSICALIGGTFTVVGLLSSFLGVLFKPKKL